MPYYSEDDIQRVIESNDIVDVVSEHIELKRAGSNYKGLCPFHSEKTPSFMVSPSKQIYHCFGCGEGGDVIGFVMKHLGIEFPEALELLADRTSIQLEKESSQENNEKNNKRNRLFDLNRDAARYFYNNLRKNRVAYNYLLNRGINDNTIKAFGIGYAYDTWEDLLNHLKSKGYQDSEMADVGLIIERKNKSGHYDRFRNRIMFPIINTKGKVIGFGGRVIDDSQPKYLNSPDSLVFAKGNNLYNLNIAKKYSRGNDIILVEGYMDVIALFNYGIKNCVASLGTAFTPNQAKLLKRYSNEFYICYDSDTAGLKATDKAFDIFKELGIDVKAIVLPSGKDPDDFIKEYGKSAFLRLKNNSLNFIDFKIHFYKSIYDLTQLEGKIGFTREIAKTLKNVKSPVEVDAYIAKISQETKISTDAIKNEIYGGTNNYKNKTNPKDKYISNKYRNNNRERIIPVKHNLEPGHLNAERNLLSLIINDKKIYAKVKEVFTPSDFLNEINRQIARLVYGMYEEENSVFEDKIINSFEGENLEKVQSIINTNIQLDDREKIKAVDDFIGKIQRYNLKIKKDEIKKQIEEIVSNNEKTEGDEETFKLLCSELTRIERELKFHR
ncbi:DNA primase [Sporosalibacterium faouarense]|uniref:DNA primase n=1 Tax=Sporosalibacterium faouarense TaxID=516123 RepID=UPI00141D21A1|nr:DNA primase [Sporosalibacterium faouarense]MTI49426.1 DNA primase [Bacillota bacterium]